MRISDWSSDVCSSDLSNLYTTNFEAHWRGDRAQINASVQYNWSNEGNYFVEQILRPGDLTSASIDFVSDPYKGGVPSIAFNGVDLSDVGSYVVDRFQEDRKSVASGKGVSKRVNPGG